MKKYIRIIIILGAIALSVFLLKHFIEHRTEKRTLNDENQELSDLYSTNDEFKENQKMIGTFYFNEGQKGGSFIFDNGTSYLLNLDELDYSKEQYLDWNGQLLEIKGTIYVHYCLEYEQCLNSGVINSFTKIDSMQAVDVFEDTQGY